MKRVSMLLAAVLLLLSLCACKAEEETVYGVERSGKTYTVDAYNQTISFDGHVCKYKLNVRSDGAGVTITYPDGSTYWWHEGGSGGSGGHSADYDPDRYAPGGVLWNVLSRERLRTDTGPEEESGHPFLGLLFLAIGVFNTAAPRAAWTLSDGWKFKDVEPSDAALAVTRVGGIIIAIIGILLIV